MVEIQNMVMQLPGVSAEEGQQLSQAVMQRVSSQLPASMGDRYLPSLDLRVQLPAGTSKGDWAAIISDSIVRQIINANR